MALVEPSTQDIPSDREIEELFNTAQDGVDNLTSSVHAEAQQPKNQRPAGNVAELGVDEEVKIEKKRRPIPKLDEARLLSDPGIPRLQKISKERLRFKGKGYEYRDIARMLNMYQLWLDDLYPRAKFSDGLAMIEKLGHSKRIQVMRKTWIDEGKPSYSTEQDGDADAAEPERSAQDTAEGMEGIESMSIPQGWQEGDRPQALLPSGTDGLPHQAGGDAPGDEDDLDAWLAESEAFSTSMTSTNMATRAVTDEADDLFADEMEAMAEMEAMEEAV